MTRGDRRRKSWRRKAHHVAVHIADPDFVNDGAVATRDVDSRTAEMLCADVEGVVTDVGCHAGSSYNRGRIDPEAGPCRSRLEVLKSISNTRSGCTGGVVDGLTALPRLVAPLSVVLLTAPSPKPVSVAAARHVEAG